MVDQQVSPPELQAELHALRRQLEEMRQAQAENARVELALRQQAQLLDLAHGAIIVRDLDSRILFWNRGAEEVYGWSREEALGLVTHTFLQTRFPQPLAQIDEKLLRDGRWEGELGHTRKDGSSIVVASRWALRRDEQGRPTAILEINNDITVRKAAQETLRRTLERLDETVRERTAELLAANRALTEEIAQRQRAQESLLAREQELEAKTGELKEVNSALQVLLRQQERYRADMEDQMLSNVRVLILPYLENLLSTHLTPDQRAQAEILESNLRNLLSQFTRRLSAANLGLTPKELQVANLIRDGKSTKEIADLLRLSPRAIVFHRQNIRQKLGLKNNKNKNLRSALLSLA